MRRGIWVVFATALVFVLAVSGGALAGKPADPGKGEGGGAAAGKPADPGNGKGKRQAPAERQADKGKGKPSEPPTQDWRGGWIHDYTEAPSAPTQSEYYVVTFDDPPAASYTGGIRGLEATKPARGQKLNVRSQEARAYAEHLKSVHANYRAFLNGKAAGAEIVAEYTFAANAVAVKANGHRPETLQQGPGVRHVAASWLYRPTMDVSNGLIGSSALWTVLGGRENAGEGIKVGVIDTGIVDDHPAFACKDEIPHKVYASGGNPPPFNLPTIVFNHGTHVAGTVAGCVLELGALDDSLDVGPTTGTWSGVAPGAQLFDYNVFPGFGGGFIAFGGSAFSHDICRAIEDAVADGMDVINMSIGGKVQGPHDFLAECTEGAVAAGLVAAVAAGNSGPGDSTVESPGTAAGALTAGASTNPHFVGVPFTATTGATTVSGGAAYGDFAHFADVTADYTETTPLNGCTSITEDLSGKIALIDRGVCTFGTKVRNAAAKGAVGVLVANNVAGDPVAMGGDGGAMPVPAAMVSKSDGAAMGASGSVTIDGDGLTEIDSANADIIAGFSSRGPTPFTYRIKPDVTAPGVNVFSSVFNEETGQLGFAYFQGTSMATPHLAGAAALLLDRNPGWGPADVKSALVQTAKRPVWDHVNGTAPTGVLTRGGGRVDLAAAMASSATVDPALVSFGFWGGNKPVLASVDISVTRAGSCSAPVVTWAGDMIGLTVSGTAPGTLTATLNGGRTAASGDYEGDIELVCDGVPLRIPWWVRIDRKGKP